MDLTDDEKRILSKGKIFDGEFKVLNNIKNLTRRPYKEVLKDLEKKGLIERVVCGKFRLTDKAYSEVVRSVSCEKCGRSFANREEARSEATLFCNHESLSFSLADFLKE